jgi:hypothetical protein
MGTWSRLLLSASMSWIFSVSLGLLFAVCVSGRCSFSALRLPGVVPVALLISTSVSVAITPIAFWSSRTGSRNLLIYAPILWMTLAVYEVAVIPRAGRLGPYGLLVLAVTGLIILGFVPARK